MPILLDNVSIAYMLNDLESKLQQFKATVNIRDIDIFQEGVDALKVLVLENKLQLSPESTEAEEKELNGLLLQCHNILKNYKLDPNISDKGRSLAFQIDLSLGVLLQANIAGQLINHQEEQV